jgi:hypothetical protein
MCWRSTVEMRRNCGGWAGANPERASVLFNPEGDSVLSLVRIIILEMSEARQKHASPQAPSAAADGIQAVRRRIASLARHTPLTPAMAMGAYVAHRHHRSCVPGSDVRVERRRPIKRLRAEPHALKETSPNQPRAPTGQSIELCTQRPVGRVRAEVCIGARRSRCGATAAVGRAQTRREPPCRQ